MVKRDGLDPGLSMVRLTANIRRHGLPNRYSGYQQATAKVLIDGYRPIRKFPSADANDTESSPVAAIDVYEEEPLRGPDHPLLKMENAVCKPHIGYLARSEYESSFPISSIRLPLMWRVPSSTW